MKIDQRVTLRGVPFRETGRGACRGPLSPTNITPVSNTGDLPRIDRLYRGTPASAGLDLAPVHTHYLEGGQLPRKISTGIWGPLPKETFGLLLGRSSSTMKGLIVYPGVIDPDYTGEINIMASLKTGTLSLWNLGCLLLN